MDITFASNRMEEASVSISAASQLFGTANGRKYIQRVNVIRATLRFSDLYGLQALRLHPLKGNRKGQFAISLTANYRLILEKLAEDRVRILSVEDYHGN